MKNNISSRAECVKIWIFVKYLWYRPNSGKERSLNIFRNALVQICELTDLCDYICALHELTYTLVCFLTLLLYLLIPPKNRDWFVLVSKLVEPPYDLRSKGKMTTINNPDRNALVLTNNLGGIRGKGWNSEYEHIARMEQEIDSLREDVQ